MAAEAPITHVMDTAFWVAYYRALETERADALFRDPLAAKLVGERGRKISEAMAGIGRYTEWSVVARTVIIDRFIERLAQEGVDAVVNLGAGLDARPYRMRLPESLEWIEADYPEMVAHKSRVLEGETPRCKLTRVEVDLADGERRREFLATVAPRAAKALILTEGVIPYLSPEQVGELASDLLAQQRFAYWIAEYFHPRVYRYLQRSVRTKAMRNAPSASIRRIGTGSSSERAGARGKPATRARSPWRPGASRRCRSGRGSSCPSFRSGCRRSPSG